MGIGTQIMGINTQNMPIGTRAKYLLFLIELALCLNYKGFLVSIFWNIYIGKSLGYIKLHKCVKVRFERYYLER